MKQAKILLTHILDEINYLLKNSAKLEFQDFINNETLKRSFVRSLEIIGEAIKNLPQNFRNNYPEVSWKEIAGLRDVLIHRYAGVDYKAVWDIVKTKIPKLKSQIERILKEIEEVNAS